MISIIDSEILEGSLPKNKLKLVLAWIELHHEELMANWELAVNGSKLFENKTSALTMNSITAVKPLENYELLLTFSNNEVKKFNLKSYLDKGIFSELKNEAYFNSVFLSFGSITWQNGQDFSPDTFY